MFGIAYSYNIHNIYYLIIVQVVYYFFKRVPWNSFYIFLQALGGIAQTTGWPGVVTVVGNWFGEGKRGKKILLRTVP